MIQIKDVEDLKQKIDAFGVAYIDLLYTWDKFAEHQHINDILSKAYPFEYSFDEYNVVGWVEDVFEDLKYVEVK